MLDGKFDQLRLPFDAELALDVQAVRLDGAHAEVELRGDLGVGVAERDQAQDVELTFGEVVGRTRRRLGGAGSS